MAVRPIPDRYHGHPVPGRRQRGPGDRVLQEGVRREGARTHGGAGWHHRSRRDRDRGLAGDALRSVPQSSAKPPKELGGTSASVFLYVEDVDAVVQQAVDAGATVAMEVADQFWGDRLGTVIDPFGHCWSIATHVEDVPAEEMEERAKAAMAAISG